MRASLRRYRNRGNIAHEKTRTGSDPCGGAAAGCRAGSPARADAAAGDTIGGADTALAPVRTYALDRYLYAQDAARNGLTPQRIRRAGGTHAGGFAVACVGDAAAAGAGDWNLKDFADLKTIAG